MKIVARAVAGLMVGLGAVPANVAEARQDRPGGGAAGGGGAVMPFLRLTSVVNAYACFSPDGRTIAFQSNANGNWDLYLMAADGAGGVRQLTNDPAADITPIFSPDGRRIVFCSERSGNRDVYVMNADGSDQRPLTDSPGHDLHPAWSPDGRRVIFSSNRGNADPADYDLYVMNADGTDQRRLTVGPEVDTYASWSPDGRQIVTRRVIDAGANNEVFLLDADGGHPRNLSNDPGAYDGWPAWSPDGKRIAFASGHPGRGDHHVYLINADGTGRTRVTSPLPGTSWAYFTQPAFSPDGRRLACTMYRPPQHAADTRESSEIVLFDLPPAS